MISTQPPSPSYKIVVGPAEIRNGYHLCSPDRECCRYTSRFGVHVVKRNIYFFVLWETGKELVTTDLGKIIVWELGILHLSSYVSCS